MEDSSLYLNTGHSFLQCRLHPVVVFSILDHYIRRNPENQMVIGTLVGTVVDNLIEIRNCFPVPHTEGKEEVGMDRDFLLTMLDLHHRVSPKDIIIGWYSTNPEINENTVVIQEFYSKEMGHSPIHLTVDTSLSNSRMDIKAYTSTTLSVGELSLGTQFLPAPLEIKTFEAERIAVDALIKTRDSGEITQMLSDLSSLNNSIGKLVELLDKVLDYVNKVLEGKIVPDTKIGRFLADAVSALPKIDPASLEKMFNSSLQDLLMIVYLTNLTRTQLSIAEKLHTKVA